MVSHSLDLRNNIKNVCKKSVMDTSSIKDLFNLNLVTAIEQVRFKSFFHIKVAFEEIKLCIHREHLRDFCIKIV